MENTATPPAPPALNASRPNHEGIAARAYELWLQDGSPTGQAEYHWHEAERQLFSAAQTDAASPYNSLQQEEPLAAAPERTSAENNPKPDRSRRTQRDSHTAPNRDPRPKL